jgi:hypothetical protein
VLAPYWRQLSQWLNMTLYLNFPGRSCRVAGGLCLCWFCLS